MPIPVLVTFMIMKADEEDSSWKKREVHLSLSLSLSLSLCAHSLPLTLPL